MEPINFIKTLSAKEHTAIARWYRHSRFVLATLCIGIALVQGYQWYQLYTLYTTKNHLYAQQTPKQQHTLNTYHALQKKVATLKKQSIFIAELTANNESLLHILEAIRTMQSRNCTLESCTVTNNHVTIAISSSTLTDINAFVTQMTANTLFRNMQLTNLSPHHTRTIATLSGPIT